MKVSLFGMFGLLVALAGCGPQKAADNSAAKTTEYADKMPKIVFTDPGVYDFGTITEGQVVEREFKFKNAGEFPLIINNLHASCGCTTPEWPKQPIKPGEESTIKVRFNSAGKQGLQSKTVTIYANTEPAYTDLAFQVMVNPRSDSAQTTARR